MSANMLKAQKNSPLEVKFSICYGGRQELDVLMAYVQSVEKTTRFARIPEEESFTVYGWRPEWKYISRLWCENPLKIIDSFREGLSNDSQVSSISLVIPASEASAEATIILTPRNE